MLFESDKKEYLIDSYFIDFSAKQRVKCTYKRIMFSSSIIDFSQKSLVYRHHTQLLGVRDYCSDAY
jgi:hypothetical protein